MDRLRQVSPRIYAFVLGTLALGFFATIAEEIVGREPVFGDQTILSTFHATATPLLNSIALFFTHAGGPSAAIIISAVLVGIFWERRERWRAVYILVVVAGAAALNVILKLLFRRDRPSLWDTIVTEKTFSFPSGHAMASSALAFGLIVLCWETRWRWPVVVVAGSYALLVGMSRVYLGVHYPSDVVAGWCISLAWALGVALCFVHYHKRLR